ncbi:MAG: L-2-amino-thiazoline-4-carboxylic acid hydrolase [Phycisphaerales bacterium]|nr:MAG: L-2-amino-thiazoline-4-carboxylic acid hydrolase [Phycisphaerales bacterium]
MVLANVTVEWYLVDQYLYSLLWERRMSYYSSGKSKLLKDFDVTADLVRDFLIHRYDREFTDTLYREARQEYENVIAEIPHIKDVRARALNSFLLITAQELALYKAMKRHGKEPGEVWEICHEAIKRRMKRFSNIKRWLLKRLMYSSFLTRRVKKRALKQEPLKFGDFELRYVLGDGIEFDWGVDYVACGNYNYVKAQGAEEFAPYVCMSDIALSDALGWGLIRTQTIADGCESCDFRFKKGSDTKISSKSPEVQATIQRIEKKGVSSNGNDCLEIQ